MNPSNGHRGITASILAIMIVLGAWQIDFYIIANGLPKIDGASHDATIMIITGWNGIAGIVAGYFFGNSANSDRKTEILANSAPAQTTTATTGDATITTAPATPPLQAAA